MKREHGEQEAVRKEDPKKCDQTRQKKRIGMRVARRVAECRCRLQRVHGAGTVLLQEEEERGLRV